MIEANPLCNTVTCDASKFFCMSAEATNAACAELLSLSSHAQGGVPLADTLLASPGKRSDAELTILQLDRVQILPLAVLQLLRHAASRGADCGELLLLHEHDSPELRLRTSPVAGLRTPSLLGGLCAVRGDSDGMSWLQRLLDFRCHQRPGRVDMPEHLRQCLQLISGGAQSASAAVDAVGAADEVARRAVVDRARLLLSSGLEASVVELARHALPAPCCTLQPSVASSGAANISASSAGLRGILSHPPGLPLLQPVATGRFASRPADSAVARPAAELMADALPLLPSSFSTAYRNPCWQCNLDAPAAATAASGSTAPPPERLCCLPSAHVLGVSKCGTTDLYARLAQHAHVLPSANKGPHFWDEAHPFEWYVRLYSRGARRLADAAAARREADVFLDASSNTFTWSGIGVRGKRAPQRVLLPHVLAWLQPQLRLLLMLREPGARYFSAYWYYNKRYRIYAAHGPLSAASFDRMARAEVAAFGACRALHSLRRCARTQYDAAQQLVKGLYAAFLPDWLGAFPPEQLLVLRLEDYEAEPAAHLRGALRFLGLPPPPRARWQRMLAQPRANRRQAGGSSILPATHAFLRAFYAPANALLADLLDDARFRWADVYGNHT